MALAEQLNKTLATVFSFYLEAHQFHWNVEGPSFRVLHDLFGDIYDDVHGSIDPIAEHIRTLDEYALHGFQPFMSQSSVKLVKSVPPPMDMVEILLEDNDKVLDSLKESFSAAEAENEQGIMNFLADRLDKHAKWKWQLRSTLKVI